ncbi:MAG: Asp-tRNA(Asn)/Glu-tRNA(Gln) amidotransferase subunit GatB, partial [Candidatus Eisenbacteria bacterium]|nr:Asp-tRNA(Asn)/Glu-tRNA(Gln) amidotransferase subunit GatB [Candidatus Eisenbacteria bacterium]
LMEIVTEPDLASPEEAQAFLLALRQILLYGEVSDCNLEQGNLRCDVNCSVRPEGQAELGTKIEIKNMNTFKGVFHALQYELARQEEVLRAAGAIRQETRRWDDEAGVTEAMRSKEYAHDYRYFPEPDLMPVVLPAETIERWRATLPELPARRRERLVRDYGLPEYDAGVLVADKAVADFFEETARQADNPKAASNWMMTEVLRSLAEKRVELKDARLTPGALASLIRLVDQKVLNVPTAREVFNELFDKGGDPADIVRQKGLAQVSDAGALEALADEALTENPGPAADYRAGKKPALQFLVGQVMKKSRGKANPRMVQDLLQRKLGGA